MPPFNVMTDAVRAGAYAAWRAARSDILTEWQAGTDPRNLRPAIPKAMRDAAELVDELGLEPPEPIEPLPGIVEVALAIGVIGLTRNDPARVGMKWRARVGVVLGLVYTLLGTVHLLRRVSALLLGA